MRAAIKHHLNVVLLVVLFLVSVIGAAISGSFIRYTTSHSWGESVGPRKLRTSILLCPDAAALPKWRLTLSVYNDRTGQWYYSQGTIGHRYYHATGAILAGFTLIWIASALL
jgi:hypothetical protein